LEIKDGLSNTIMIAETTGQAIPWTEPRDIDFDDFDFIINGPTGHGIGSTHRRGANVLLSDGSVRFVPQYLDSKVLRGLLTVAGGEQVSPP
jgi:prepilin-type processing-associated H-X9-DG protein